MMFDRLLVPLDGSDTADRGLAQAEALLTRTGGEAVLLRAVPSAAGLRGESFDRLVSGEKAEAEDALKLAAGRLSEKRLRARWDVAAGDPAEAILEAARREDVGLIVICTHGRSGLRRWALGSTAERVLRSTERPVLLVRARSGADATEARTILLASDGSEAARAAVDPAAAWAARFGAEIAVLSVDVPEVVPLSAGGSTLAGPWAVPAPVGAPAREEGRAVAEGLAEEIAARGIRAHGESATGDPARTIVERAKALGAGLIAMATHGRSGLDRWFMGSVTEKVLREAETPMLVVRSTARR